jgi:hypothetical protein
LKVRYSATTLALSGQDGTPGEFSLQTGVADIALVLAHLSKRSASVSVIAHCATGVGVIEYLRLHEANTITCAAIYGLLFNPARRRRAALPRLRDAGVVAAIETEAWNYDTVASVSRIRRPLLFCHALDKLNLKRATVAEIDSLVDAAPLASVQWFERGYDSDITQLPPFVDAYHEWLLRRVALKATSTSHE